MLFSCSADSSDVQFISTIITMYAYNMQNNGKPAKVEAETIRALVVELGFPPRGVLVVDRAE